MMISATLWLMSLGSDYGPHCGLSGQGDTISLTPYLHIYLFEKHLVEDVVLVVFLRYMKY